MNFHKYSLQNMHNRKRQFSENPCEDVGHYFNKRYSFCHENNWHTPKPANLYTEENWKLNSFQNMKTELNDVKRQLSDFNLDEWSQHTKIRDPSGYVFRELKKFVKPELLTQAWCKFYECINQYPILCEEAINDNVLHTLHLCEAPGAFICALNHYIVSNHPELKWEWIVNSLNPEYEGNHLSHMIADKRLFNHTRQHWKFGSDGTGDILEYYNYESIVSEALKLGKILLITADGSVDCMSNPGEQECLVEHLHFCEVVTALTVLAEGGSFVIKMFTMFECSTICLLYLLNNCFRKVHVFKPCTSKSGNSEVYVICLEYNGKNVFNKLLDKLRINYKNKNTQFSMFPLKDIPNSFTAQVEECVKYFMSKQIETINDNIMLFENVSRHKYRKNDYIKNAVAQCFLYKYKLLSIDKSKFLTNTIIIDDRSDLIFPEKSNMTCATFFLQHDIILQFDIGKKISQVFYSEFCEQKFIKKLTNLNETISPYIFQSQLVKMKVDENDYCVVNLSFSKDNKIYALCMFNLFHETLLKLNYGNNVALISSIYLTRFEASLFYLFMACFQSVEYCSGVIILKIVTENLHNIREHYNIINEKLKNITNINSPDFVPFILNLLPINLLHNESFLAFLKCYNNKTLDYFCIKQKT